MRAKRALFILVTALWAARPCVAGGAGADPFDFLFLDANARAVGMGGAYTALATDANALLYNPAGLSKVGRYEATLMHNQHFEGITQEYLGFAAKQGWGLSLNYLRFGDTPRTTISNPNGSGLGEAELTAMALGAGYARSVVDWLSLGIAGKYIRESIDGISADGVAMDVGLLAAAPDLSGFKFGAALQNVGPNVKFQHAEENLPLTARLGAAYELSLLGNGHTVSADITKARKEGALFGVGLESRLVSSLPIRLGFSSRNDAGWGLAAGFGWSRRDFSLDYAFIPYGDLGYSHRISATMRWGGEKDTNARRMTATLFNNPGD